MEKLLGVKLTDGPPSEPDLSRRDVNEADQLEETERRDAARQRYQRMYWESVPEDGRVRYLKQITCAANIYLDEGTHRSGIA